MSFCERNKVRTYTKRSLLLMFTVRQYVGSRQTTGIGIYPKVERNVVDVTLHQQSGRSRKTSRYDNDWFVMECRTDFCP